MIVVVVVCVFGSDCVAYVCAVVRVLSCALVCTIVGDSGWLTACEGALLIVGVVERTSCWLLGCAAVVLSTVVWVW